MSEPKPANAEMVQGYMDGYDMNAPEPSSNRSFSYRHGFAVGRAEKTGNKLADYNALVRMAQHAMDRDGDCI